jgi:hypothetical protein
MSVMLSIFYPLFSRVIMELYPEDIPSMNNVYSSKYWEKVKEDEQNRSDNMYQQSKKPFETGVLAKPVNSDIFSSQVSSYEPLNNNEYISSLSGEKLNKENFTHNNMQPFLRKNVTQNTDIESMSAKLDSSTGNNRFWKNKQEVPNFFQPVSNMGNICGMKNNDDFYKSRIDVIPKANNFFPIEPVRVGPGLNQGYDSKGIGGFHQTNTLDYAKPRTIDELRSKINQKNTYFEIPFQAPIKGTEQRGMVTPYAKNRPDKTFRQTEDQWIKTTGAIMKESNRPNQYVKPTARVDSHKQYEGIKSNNNLSLGIKDDYGKNNIIVYNTERQTTQNKSTVSNLTSIVKAIVAPVVDALKYTMKEYTVESARGVGNPSIQIPEKPTLYDPDNHIMKTTIKETTVHNSEMNNLTGNKETYSALQDDARTTVKETTIHDSEMNNLTGNKETYSALEDEARTTTKETTIHDSEMNNLTGNKETYSALQDLAKTTVKETLIHDTVVSNIKGREKAYVKSGNEAKKTHRQTLPKVDTTRNIGTAVYKVYVYDPDMVAKTTMKQTTIKGKSEFGFLGGMLEGLFGGYLSTPVELKNTQKQFLSDTNEYGIASGGVGDHRQTDRTAEENAEIDGTREAIMMAAGHTPNPGNMNLGIDSSEVDMTSRKPVENDIPYRESANIGITYQTSPQLLDECSITKVPDKMNNAFENRLDSDLLEPITTNEFAIRINPIKNCRI